MLTREDVLKTQRPVRTSSLAVPEWNGEVYVRMLSSKERIDWQIAMTDESGKPFATRMQNLHARFAVVVLCDESGKRLFEDKDADELGKEPATALARIYDAALRFNKMRPEDEETAEKN